MTSVSAVINIDSVESGGTNSSSTVGGSSSSLPPPPSSSSGPMSAGSSSSAGGSSNSSIVYVQDLVNEMTHSVLQTATSSASAESEDSNSPVQLIKRPFDSCSKDGSKSASGFAQSSHSTKRARSSKSTHDELSIRQKLEQRLGGILCCAVCLDLPKSSVYQVWLVKISLL